MEELLNTLLFGGFLIAQLAAVVVLSRQDRKLHAPAPSPDAQESEPVTLFGPHHPLRHMRWREV